MAVRDDRSDVKQTTTGFRGPLMVQSLTSAKSKFLSLGMLFRIPTLMLQINNRWDYLCSTLYDFSSSEKRVMVIENKENIGLRLRKIIFDYKHRDRHLKLQDSVLSKRILTNSEKNSSIKIIDKILV